MLSLSGRLRPEQAPMMTPLSFPHLPKVRHKKTACTLEAQVNLLQAAGRKAPS